MGLSKRFITASPQIGPSGVPVLDTFSQIVISMVVRDLGCALAGCETTVVSEKLQTGMADIQGHAAQSPETSPAPSSRTHQAAIACATPKNILWVLDFMHDTLY